MRTRRTQTTHLGIGVVASPIWSDTGLSAEIPYLEVDVLVGDCFNVETDCYKR